MNSIIEQLKEVLASIPNARGEWTEFRGERTLFLSKDALLSLCLYARDHLSFDMLLDIATIDMLDECPRFRVVYQLYSLKNAEYLRIKTAIGEEETLPSLVSVWPAADWHEREAYDMMGILFEGHPNLKRILMWEGYPYYPMRKDFPLAGKPSDMDDVAFTEPAPMAGGPFVTIPTEGTTEVREPRSREEEILR